MEKYLKSSIAIFYGRNNPDNDYDFVVNAIASLTDTQFDKLQQAETMYWDTCGRERSKAYTKMLYWCKKIGITINDYWAWCDC